MTNRYKAAREAAEKIKNQALEEARKELSQETINHGGDYAFATGVLMERLADAYIQIAKHEAAK